MNLQVNPLAVAVFADQLFGVDWKWLKTLMQEKFRFQGFRV